MAKQLAVVVMLALALAVLNSPRFRADLATERRLAEDDAASVVRFWPIISVGVRYGLR